MGTKRFFNVVEAHAGEPMRVITGGVPNVPGNTVYEQMLYLKEHDNQIKNLMLREPRGYPPLCCNLIVPAKNERASAGYIIMEQTEYPLMSGGNTISVATVLLETGMLPMKEPETEFLLEAPAGLIPIKAQCKDGKVTGVTFTNVPAFAAYLDKEIDVPTIGKVPVDIAWGGAWFVIADPKQFEGLKLKPSFGGDIAKFSSLLVKAAQEQCPVRHPDYPDIPITLAQFSEPSDSPDSDYRNAVTVLSGDVDFNRPETWTGALDRSPCGTGTCARMATLYARGKLGLNEDFINEGILGLKFKGTLLEEVKVGEYTAVVPTITGQAWIYGYSNYILDSTDPFTEGFTVGDIWS